MQNKLAWKSRLTSFQCGFLLLVLLMSSPAFGTVNTTVSGDCVSCDGTATFTPGVGGNVQYEWFNQLGGLLFFENNNFGSSSVFNLCPGLYQVQWTNGTENGQEWFTVNTTSVSAGQPVLVEVCSSTGFHNLNLDLNAGTDLSGAWFDPFGNPISNLVNPATTNPGFYSYQLQDGTCFVTSGVQLSIIENADPGLSTTYLICENYEAFNLLDVMAGDPDSGGQWFDANVNPVSGIYDPAIDVTGLFTYRIDSVVGCPPVFSTMMVIENPLPNPGENTTVSVCPSALNFNMTDALDGSPAATGQWYDEDFNPVDPLFDSNVQTAGVYNYVVTGLTPCPVQESFLTINFTDEISAGENALLQVCENSDPINLFEELGGNPTSGGDWTGPNGVQDEVLIGSEMISGDYSYTVEGMGCEPQTALVSIDVEILPNAGEPTSIEVCENASPIELNELLVDADEGGSWYILGENISGNLMVEGGQTYELVYEVVGVVCPSASTSYMVISDVLPTAGTDATIDICVSEESIDLSQFMNDPGLFTSEWTNPEGEVISGELTLSEVSSGLYTYTVYSANVCPDDQAVISLNIGIPAFENGSIIEEGCAEGQLVNLDELLPVEIPVGGTWQSEGLDIEGLLLMDVGHQGQYSYTVGNTFGCEPSVFNVDVNYSDQLSAGEGVPITLCSDGTPISLSQQILDASMGGSWITNGVTIDDEFDPQTDLPGTYLYVVPANGFCSADTAAVVVEVEDGFLFDLGPDIEICESETTVQVGNSDCNTCTYQWEDSSLLSELSNPQPFLEVPDVESSQTFQLLVTVSNGACLVQDEMNVIINPEPTITINLPDPICQGTEVEFEATGAASFEWSANVEGNDQFATGTFFETEIVTVVGTNEFGCAGRAAAPIDVFFLPDAVFDLEPSSACAPLTVSLEMPYLSDENTSYHWDINGQLYMNSVETITIQDPGQYDVTLISTASNGCQNSFTLDALFEVFGYPQAYFEFNSDELNSLFSHAEFVNLSTDNSINHWDFGDGATSLEIEPSHSYPSQEDQGYRVCLEVENDHGCSDVYCQEFFIPGEFLVYVPNAFTPDLDGVNDVFTPLISGIDYSEYEFTIYNRWGEKVFFSDSPEIGWIGNVGQGAYYVQNEVYTWVLSVKDLYSAEIHTLKGHVTLLR